MFTPDLILIDGSSYLYRAYHALPPLTTSQGEPSGATYGIINMLRRLLKDYQPDHIAVIFDAKGKTFRDHMFAEYKAHRPPMPDDLKHQIPAIHEIIKAMGLPVLSEKGVEADDVIATLARQAASHQNKVLVISGDKDLAQLVNSHIHILDTMSNMHYDRQAVIEKFGVTPEQIPDYLALVGDKVDNIPGVEKCGPKTAVKWLLAYGSLDKLIENAEKIKGKVGENLRDALNWLPTGRQLATVHDQVPLTLTMNDLNPTPSDNAELYKWFLRLEFKNWLKEIQTPTSNEDISTPQCSTKPNDYECILDEEALNHWLNALENTKLFAIDTETSSLEYMQAKLIGISLAISPGKAAYIPLAHHYDGSPVQLPIDAILKRLKPILENPGYGKLGHNLKYDYHIFANYDIELNGIVHDTMLESYILDAAKHRHDLDSLALAHLHHQTIHYEDVAGKGKNQINFAQVDIDKATAYAAEDADITYYLHQTLWPQIQATPTLQSVYETLEIPLIPVLSRIEHHGVCIDAERLQIQSRNLADRLQSIETEVHEIAGLQFNLSSPKQLQEILFEQLQLPIIRKTPTGQPSTAEDVLAELAEHHPLPKLILEHRGLAKLKSTYTDQLPLKIDTSTHRIHPSFQQAVTSTGRLACTDPNLQNIPIRSPEGRLIRQAFIAPTGCSLIAADYSQIELRIMAHLSGDQGLLDAFAKDLDIHRATASEVFGTSIEKISPEQRRAAKAINFGLIYGMSAFGLSKQLGISRSEAQDYITLYFSRYPGVKNYMEETRKKAREQGYVETLFGRRLYIANLHARNPQQRAQAERMAINAPMQGTAADIIKRAMIMIDQWLLAEAQSTHMILQVHDELVFETEDHNIQGAVNRLRDFMEHAAELTVPLKVDIGIGKNWDEAH